MNTIERYKNQLAAEHDASVRAEADAQNERARQNAATRDAYLARLEAEREAERAEADAALDAKLAPQKDRICREWLANHLGKTEADFEQAWKILRPNAVADLKSSEHEQIKASFRRAGTYAL
jgi:regulator of protease activity HflC (stomatin/prohibitin superfamily)